MLRPPERPNGTRGTCHLAVPGIVPAWTAVSETVALILALGALAASLAASRGAPPLPPGGARRGPRSGTARRDRCDKRQRGPPLTVQSSAPRSASSPRCSSSPTAAGAKASSTPSAPCWPSGPPAARSGCSHLANSASLLLPVSNLTNLLAFRASGLRSLASGDTDGAALARRVERGVGRALPVLRPNGPAEPWPARAPIASPHWARFALTVLALTLAGLAFSSVLGIPPVTRRRGAARPACGRSGLRRARSSNLVKRSRRGPGPVLAALIGVNVGPNLTYAARSPPCCGAGCCAQRTPRSNSASFSASER